MQCFVEYICEKNWKFNFKFFWYSLWVCEIHDKRIMWCNSYTLKKKRINILYKQKHKFP
jgi:hypothetical protein